MIRILLLSLFNHHPLIAMAKEQRPVTLLLLILSCPTCLSLRTDIRAPKIRKLREQPTVYHLVVAA